MISNELEREECSWVSTAFVLDFDTGNRRHLQIKQFSTGRSTVIVPLRVEMAGWKRTKLEAEAEFFHLSEVGLVKGEILALLTCTCIRVGKSRPPKGTPNETIVCRPDL